MSEAGWGLVIPWLGIAPSIDDHPFATMLANANYGVPLFMEKITTKILDASSPTCLYDEVGQDLAKFLIHPHFRTQVGLKGPPTLPAHPGSAAILLVTDREAIPSTVVADGFALPVQWLRDADMSPALPPALAEVARSVYRTLAQIYPGLAEPWGLNLDPSLEGRYDLSQLPGRFESAWAPLAAALAIAAQSGQPRPWVLSTGAWSSGIDHVSGIAQKLRAIANLAHDQDPVVFVPYGNYEEARRLAEDLHPECPSRTLKVHHYDSGRPVLESLREHLKALDAPPDDDASVDAKLAYVNRVDGGPSDYTARDEYHWSSLVNDLGDELRRRTDLPKLRALAAVPSDRGHPGVLGVLIRALEPGHVLVATTPETTDTYAMLEARFSEVVLTRVEVPAKDDLEPAIETITAFLRTHAPAAVDVTGGRKVHSLMLAEAARRAGADVLNLATDFSANRAKFGTESIERYDWFAKRP